MTDGVLLINLVILIPIIIVVCVCRAKSKLLGEKKDDEAKKDAADSDEKK